MAKIKSAVAESTTSPENLVSYQEIDLHMIFDINLGENFRHKARLLAGEYKKKYKLVYKQFSGIARISAYTFTYRTTQQFISAVGRYRKCLLDRSLPREDMDERRY